MPVQCASRCTLSIANILMSEEMAEKSSFPLAQNELLKKEWCVWVHTKTIAEELMLLQQRVAWIAGPPVPQRPKKGCWC